MNGLVSVDCSVDCSGGITKSRTEGAGPSDLDLGPSDLDLGPSDLVATGRDVKGGDAIGGDAMGEC